MYILPLRNDFIYLIIFSKVKIRINLHCSVKCVLVSTRACLLIKRDKMGPVLVW